MSEYLFVKPGLSAGGASFADILTSAALREETGENVRFLAGFCSPLAAAALERYGIDLQIDPLLDRETEASPDVVAETILDHTNEESRLVLSQFFAKKEALLGSAAVGLAQRLPTAIRMHNYIAPEAAAAFEQLPDSTIQLPIHDYMAARMLQLRPTDNAITIPPVFDTNRFIDNGEPGVVRQHIGITEDDLLIVQPTVLAARKSPETSLHLAHELQRETGRRAVMLFGGNTQVPEAVETIGRLNVLNRQLRVDCRFDGMDFRHFHDMHRIGDLLHAADLASMPSYQDDVMLTLAEASFVQVPIYTRAYVDGDGAPLYDASYGALDALVQRDMQSRPDPVLVGEAAKVVRGERHLDLAANARYAQEKFSTRGIAPKLRLLHELFSLQ